MAMVRRQVKMSGEVSVGFDCRGEKKKNYNWVREEKKKVMS